MPYRYWQVKNDYFQFGYYTNRNPDGKFHVFKSNMRTKKVKELAFAKRKRAKARAYKWYCDRMVQLDERAKVKAIKPKKPQLSAQEKKIQQLKRKIANADARMNDLGKIITQSRIRIKRAENRYSKWQKKQARWIKEWAKLESKSDRIKALIDTL